MSEPHALLENTHLAFEEGIEESPPELWRIVSMRPFGGKELRHINWFATKEAADIHAKWINARRGKVLSVVKYRKDVET